jgi:hypothetical protein
VHYLEATILSFPVLRRQRNIGHVHSYRQTLIKYANFQIVEVEFENLNLKQLVMEMKDHKNLSIHLLLDYATPQQSEISNLKNL